MNNNSNNNNSNVEEDHTLLAIPNRIWWKDGGHLYFDNETDPFFDDPVVKLHILVGAIQLKSKCDDDDNGLRKGYGYDPRNLTLDECVIATTINLKISQDITLVRPSTLQTFFTFESFSNSVAAYALLPHDKMMMTKSTLDLIFTIHNDEKLYPTGCYDLPSDIVKLERVRELKLGARCRSIHPEIACMEQLKNIAIHERVTDGVGILPPLPTMPNIEWLELWSFTGENWYLSYPQVMSVLQAFPSLSYLYLEGISSHNNEGQQLIDLFQEAKTIPFKCNLKYLGWPSFGLYCPDDYQLKPLLFKILPEFPNVQSFRVNSLKGFTKIVVTHMESSQPEGDQQLPPHTRNRNLEDVDISWSLAEINITTIDRSGRPKEASKRDVDENKLQLHPRIQSKLAINGSGQRFFKDKSVPLSLWPAILARIQGKAWNNKETSLYYALRYGPALCAQPSLESDDA